jgi:hypothetical protein
MIASFPLPDFDKYLCLSADIAYDVLRELGSLGVALLEAR